MQVGMVVGESIVLAGDKRWSFDIQLANGMGWPGGRWGGNATKIKISRDGKMAVACAENMEFSGRIAEVIIDQITGEPTDESIKDLADSVTFRERKSQLLIACVRSSPKLYKYASWREEKGWVSSCQRWDNLAISGDRTNAAIFYAERYHKDVSTVDEGIFLSAHLVVSSEILNTAGIQGLEVAVCSPDGITLMSDEEIKMLRLRSLQNDKRIGNLIFDHRVDN